MWDDLDWKFIEMGQAWKPGDVSLPASCCLICSTPSASTPFLSQTLLQLLLTHTLPLLASYTCTTRSRRRWSSTWWSSASTTSNWCVVAPWQLV